MSKSSDSPGLSAPQVKVFCAAAVALASHSSGLANEAHIALISQTPCLEEYRLWAFASRRSAEFQVPERFTPEQCAAAIEVNKRIQTEAFAESQADKARWRREEMEREAERARQASVERARQEAQARRPFPRIGMTASTVKQGTNWGAPSHVNRTTTARGTFEQWVYEGYRYLYFDNGKLTAIQD